MSRPSRFSPTRFHQYAQDLSAAVYELSDEAMKFRITEPVFFLGAQRQPGDVLESRVGPYRYEAGTGKRTAQFVELPSEIQTIAAAEVGPVATVLPPMPTPVQAPVTPPSLPSGRSMSITGIQSGLFEAKMVEMQKKLADRINKGLSKIDGAVEAGATKMDAAVDGVVAKVDKEIDDKLQEFAAFTNGGPV